MSQLEELLEAADSFTIATLDEGNFPHLIAVSKPLERNSHYYFKFYINGDGKTAENIEKNRIGSLFAVNTETHESVALKGFLLIEELDKYEALAAAQLNDFQRSLDYAHPVVCVFETLSVKHYQNHQAHFLDVEK